MDNRSEDNRSEGYLNGERFALEAARHHCEIVAEFRRARFTFAGLNLSDAFD
jgi:hypothetical protein